MKTALLIHIAKGRGGIISAAFYTYVVCWGLIIFEVLS